MLKMYDKNMSEFNDLELTKPCDVRFIMVEDKEDLFHLYQWLLDKVEKYRGLLSQYAPDHRRYMSLCDMVYMIHDAKIGGKEWQPKGTECDFPYVFIYLPVTNTWALKQDMLAEIYKFNTQAHFENEN